MFRAVIVVSVGLCWRWLMLRMELYLTSMVLHDSEKTKTIKRNISYIKSQMSTVFNTENMHKSWSLIVISQFQLWKFEFCMCPWKSFIALAWLHPHHWTYTRILPKSYNIAVTNKFNVYENIRFLMSVFQVMYLLPALEYITKFDLWWTD